MNSKRVDILLPWCVGIAAAVLRVVFWATTPHTWEDALITLRYAENIAAGNGFVYNIGEHVLGTTTPPYTLFLAMFQTLGVASLPAGKFVNLVADSATAGIVTSMFLSYRMRMAGLAAGLSYAASAANVKWAVSGMETGLYTFAIVLALATWRRARHVSVLSATAACWIRPDGIIVLPALLLVEWTVRIPRRALVVALLVAAAWLFFATAYFGSPVPHSLTAKSVLYMERTNVAGNIKVMIERLLFMLPVVSPILVTGFVLGVFFCWRKPELRALTGWTLLYLTSFALSGTSLHGWYLAPPLVGVLAICMLGWFSLASWVLSRSQAPAGITSSGVLAAITYAVIVVVVCGGGVLGLRLNQTKVRVGQQYEDTVRKRMGLWLAENTPSDATVALEPIGYIGYYSKRRILDTAGLVSPEVTKLYRGGEEPYSVGLFMKLQPDWVVVRNTDKLTRTQQFLDRYALVQIFPSDLEDRDPAFTSYSVYRRR